MNILVVGCGKVGSALACELSQEGYEVSVLDSDSEHFERLGSEYDGLITEGIPIDEDVLRRAGIENCDAVAAVSSDDNINIMVSQVAHEIFKVPTVLARIYDPRREDVFSHFGLTTICPTNLTVSAIKSALIEPQHPKTVSFDNRAVQFTTVSVPRELVGKKVQDLDFSETENLFAIQTELGEMILFKGENYRLKAGDKLIISELID